MDAWLPPAALLSLLAATWLWLRLRKERERLPGLLEELTGRAVLGFSPRGRLLGLGPRACRLLGLEGRVDPIGSADLPLDGLDDLLCRVRQAHGLERAGGVSLRLHRPDAAVPLDCEFVEIQDGPFRRPLWLALAVAKAVEDPQPRAEEAPSERPLTGSRILVAEDSPDNQLLISYLLQGQGADLVLVEDGAAAVERALAERFDVIFLDMRMPVMEGYEAAKLIRQQSEFVPIVALTARTDPEDERLCRQAGCSHYLAKPFKRRELIELATKLTGQSKLLRDPEAALRTDPEYQALVAEFVADLGIRLSQMQRALESEDWIKLEGLAHQLKGAAGSFGLPAISEASSKVERSAAREPDHECTVEALRELEQLVLTTSPAS